MNLRTWFRPVLLVTITATTVGCSGMGATTFVHPDFNFGYIERVAIVPFENLTQEQGAAYRATRYFMAELLAAEAFDVVEPGEVGQALQQRNLVRTGEIETKEVIALGKELGVQALILGSVGEASQQRSGTGVVYNVTLVVRMLETDTGSTVWSTTHTAGGRGFWSTLFGTADKSESEVMRRCVEESVQTLIH